LRGVEEAWRLQEESLLGLPLDPAAPG